MRHCDKPQTENDLTAGNDGYISLFFENHFHLSGRSADSPQNDAIAEPTDAANWALANDRSIMGTPQRSGLLTQR
jgi:hypothetical protein